MTARRKQNPQSAVDAWNAAHPVGTAVNVRKDGGEIVEGETRTHFGGGTVVWAKRRWWMRRGARRYQRESAPATSQFALISGGRARNLAETPKGIDV
jgi:hypothetical protein